MRLRSSLLHFKYPVFFKSFCTSINTSDSGYSRAVEWYVLCSSKYGVSVHTRMAAYNRVNKYDGLCSSTVLLGRFP